MGASYSGGLPFFTKAGSFVFGSGLAIVPFLHQGVVQQQCGWLTAPVIVATYGLAGLAVWLFVRSVA